MAKIFHSFNAFMAFVQANYLYALVFPYPPPGIDFPAESQSYMTTFRHYSGVLLILLLVLSKYIKGWSTVTIPNALCTLFISITVFIEPNTSLYDTMYAVSLAFLMLHIASVLYFTMYTLIPPSGRFKVGYIDAKHNGLQFAIYYPSDKGSNHSPRFMMDEIGYQKMYEISGS